MNQLQIITKNGEPDSEDMKVLVDGMLSYHASHGHIRKQETYSISLKDNDQFVGAIIVGFLWNGMSINSLWVHESLRGQGWGSKLLKMAEEEGVKRKCTLAYTDTFTYQAPDFYKKCGYTEYGKLEDFPHGETLFYLKKEL